MPEHVELPPDSDETLSGRERRLIDAVAREQARLVERDFAELRPEELRALRGLMGDIAVAAPPQWVHRSRREHPGPGVDVRAMLRAGCGPSGGLPPRLPPRRCLHRPHPLVLLCDVSGSMEPYARAYLHLLHAAVDGARAEAFVFATRLTRLTEALRSRQPSPAIERAIAAERQHSSSTRLGDSLAQLNDEHGRRGMTRGAVVVIISDGWERGDPALVAREMQRLQRLAHRIVWVNPRKASRDFAPLTGGMAAALPYCNAFLSGHNLRALSAVAQAISA